MQLTWQKSKLSDLAEYNRDEKERADESSHDEGLDTDQEKSSTDLFQQFQPTSPASPHLSCLMRRPSWMDKVKKCCCNVRQNHV